MPTRLAARVPLWGHLVLCPQFPGLAPAARTGSMTRVVALFGDMKKRDWVFVALCLLGAIICAIGGVYLAMDYRAHRGTSEFSSSHRPAK